MRTIQKATTMGNTMIMVSCLWTVLYVVIVSANKKSHNMWLTKVDKPFANESWIDLHNMEVKKLNKNAKTLSFIFDTKQDLDSDEFLCEIKIYQKTGNRYLKAPVDFPKQPCCKLFKDNKAVWSCVQKNSSLPEECPIKKGKHWVYDINPDICNPADNLPSNLAEDYKVTVTLTYKYELILKVTGYGKLKKKMELS